jgi:hypothetical protein
MGKPENKGKLAERIFWIVLILCLLAAGARFCRQRYCKDRIVVYDLTWQAADTNDIIYHKWRYFLNSRTKLPLKIEKYSTADPNSGYALEEVLVID